MAELDPQAEPPVGASSTWTLHEPLFITGTPDRRYRRLVREVRERLNTGLSIPTEGATRPVSSPTALCWPTKQDSLSVPAPSY